MDQRKLHNKLITPNKKQTRTTLKNSKQLRSETNLRIKCNIFDSSYYSVQKKNNC